VTRREQRELLRRLRQDGRSDVGVLGCGAALQSFAADEDLGSERASERAVVVCQRSAAKCPSRTHVDERNAGAPKRRYNARCAGGGKLKELAACLDFQHWCASGFDEKGVSMVSAAPYRIRVRGTVYLWGSSEINQDLTFPQPLILHVRNETLGEDVSLSIASSAGAPADIGTLSAGQSLSIPLQDLTGVIATCELQSKVSCRVSSN
jgi:hypothetical protein